MNGQWLTVLGLWFYAIALGLLSARILIKRRPVGITLSWLLFLYILPGLGMLAYLMFGERYLGRRRARRAKEQFNYYSSWLRRIAEEEATREDQQHPMVMDLAQRSLGMPVVYGSQWQSYSAAPQFFAQFIQDIEQAETIILLEFYIVEAAGAVEPVLQALEQAAERGVSIRMMLDSVGSNAFLHSQRCRRLQQKGVKVVDALHANLLRMLFRRQDLRQHRKLISIDNRIAYTGSMNLADPRFFKAKAGVGQWVDIMVRLQGNIVHLAQGSLIFDWEMETGVRLEKYLTRPSLAKLEGGVPMQLVPSGPALDEDILLQVLLTAIHNARDEVVITTPYFVPDEALLQALKTTAKRGLKVRVIVPRRNDSKLAQYAGRSFYQELLQSGVEIHRFNGGLLHTKTVLIDNRLLLIGSVNLDMRSIWLNFEVTLIVDSEAFCADIRATVDRYLRHSEPLQMARWQSRSYPSRVLENLAQLASPLL